MVREGRFGEGGGIPSSVHHSPKKHDPQPEPGQMVTGGGRPPSPSPWVPPEAMRANRKGAILSIMAVISPGEDLAKCRMAAVPHQLIEAHLPPRGSRPPASDGEIPAGKGDDGTASTARARPGRRWPEVPAREW